MILSDFIRRNHSIILSHFWRCFCFVLHERCCREWGCSFVQFSCWKH